jgi:hypothetical protein
MQAVFTGWRSSSSCSCKAMAGRLLGGYKAGELAVLLDNLKLAFAELQDAQLQWL